MDSIVTVLFEIFVTLIGLLSSPATSINMTSFFMSFGARKLSQMRIATLVMIKLLIGVSLYLKLYQCYSFTWFFALWLFQIDAKNPLCDHNGLMAFFLKPFYQLCYYADYM